MDLVKLPSLHPDRAARIDALIDRLGPVVLGDRLGRVRARMGLSIRDVAGRAGVSKTSLVRLEHGHRCRASTVARVCDVLGVHLERLADTPPDGVGAVHRRANDRWVDMEDIAAPAAARPARGTPPPAVAVNLLRSRVTNGRVLPTILEIRRPSIPRSHPGEEFVFVLSGRLRLTVGTSTFTLARGESMCFFSGEPHAYAPVGSRPVRVLSIRVDG